MSSGPGASAGGPEGNPADPLAALTGSLLRAEIRARCPGLSPVLVHGAMVGWAEPGFTGEPAAVHLTSDGPGEPLAALSVLVPRGAPNRAVARSPTP